MPRSTIERRADGELEKVCPGCQRKRWWSPENGGGAWYMREREYLVEPEDGSEPYKQMMPVPSPYCRKCSNKRRTERRRQKARLEAIRQVDPRLASTEEARKAGPCSICGLRSASRTFIEEPYPAIVCGYCHSAIQECGGDVQVALKCWADAMRHMADENRLQREHEERNGDGRRRRAHHLLEMPPGHPRDHTICIMLQFTWLKVPQWLKRESERAAAAGDEDDDAEE